MKDTKIKKVAMRDLQHNLTMYVEMAKVAPVVVTKHGKEAVLMINPVKYHYMEKKNKPYRTKDAKFIGMYKDRKDWEGLSNSDVANKLRGASWYGK
ncbi:MAG: hypothetical protein UX44_C0007G0004 [candidate division WWE3 bacterium GW2011_GWA1_46_21]|uniref:Antitoxin n=2 Tax=Katanobacteria TaxID=422282 RepID=A0A0G1SD46_UNCKA|nr:MAG: hypothetical protein UX44_C0007G0004 [candidate division WWE3 bacterium GW2011_GWA1_46_21]KKU57571.1 MAG: hypothetical protein UX79_C0008G0005 [candidate division WWE3 bacterium GW2011_GWB1_47_11]